MSRLATNRTPTGLSFESHISRDRPGRLRHREVAAADGLDQKAAAAAADGLDQEEATVPDELDHEVEAADGSGGEMHSNTPGYAV